MIIIFPYERQNCCELFSEFVFEIFPSLDSNPCVVLSECPITTDLPLYSPPWGGGDDFQLKRADSAVLACDAECCRA